MEQDIARRPPVCPSACPSAWLSGYLVIRLAWKGPPRRPIPKEGKKRGANENSLPAFLIRKDGENQSNRDSMHLSHPSGEYIQRSICPWVRK